MLMMSMPILLNAATGSTTELLDSYGNTSTDWSTINHTVTTDALYYFVFVSGSFDYDFTGSVTAASATGNSPLSGAISASAAGTAASGISAATSNGSATGASTFSNVFAIQHERQWVWRNISTFPLTAQVNIA